MFLFKDGLTVWTAVMAIAIICTAIFSLISWRNSINKDKENITKTFYKEFIDIKGINIFDSFAKSPLEERIIISMAFSALNIKPEIFIKFLVKLGKFLKYKKIHLEDLEFYFKEYLFMENEIVTLMNNLGTLKIILEKEDFDHLNYLIISIFPNFKELVRKNFNINYRQKVGNTP